MMIASPLWGTVADRYGRKLMVERSMFGGAVIMGAMSLVTSAEQLVILRAIQGTITGVVSATNALVAGVVPRERMGYAMGIIQLGALLGTAIGPFMGGVLADALGFHAAFVATAVLLLIAGVLVHFGVEEDFVPSVTSTERPHFLTDWKRIFQTQGVIVAYVLRFISWMARISLLPFVPLFVMSLMSSDANVATITGVLTGVAALTGMVSAYYSGRLGDQIGHRKIFIWGAFFTACCLVPQAFVTNVWQLLVLQALVGAGAYSILPSLSALLAELTKPGDEGMVYGLENSVTAASRAIAPLIGSAFALWFGLRSTFILAAALFLLATVIAIYFLPRSGSPKPIGTTLQPSPAAS